MSKKISSGFVHTVPADLRKQQIADTKMLDAWEDITPLARNEWTCWITSPKKIETRTEHMIKNRYNSLVSKNKSNKKQKEEEIANKIFKQLAKNMEGETNECKSPVVKN